MAENSLEGQHLLAVEDDMEAKEKRSCRIRAIMRRINKLVGLWLGEGEK